jgi:choline dehydrogenase-like flavoprotein
LNLFSKKFLNKAGYPKSEDFNGYQQEGFGRLPMTVKNGMRCNTASAYLRPAMTRENLTVVDSTLTHKVLFNETNAKGIRVSSWKKTSETFDILGNEIILCGGAINWSLHFWSIFSSHILI